MEAFLAVYSDLKDRSATEREKLRLTANWMDLAFHTMTPKNNKTFVLNLIPRIVEGRNVRYVTGSGQTKPTADRVNLFRMEGNCEKVQRPPRKKREENCSSLAMAGSMVSQLRRFKMANEYIEYINFSVLCLQSGGAQSIVSLLDGGSGMQYRDLPFGVPNLGVGHSLLPSISSHYNISSFPQLPPLAGQSQPPPLLSQQQHQPLDLSRQYYLGGEGGAGSSISRYQYFSDGKKAAGGGDLMLQSPFHAAATPSFLTVTEKGATNTAGHLQLPAC